MSWPSRDPLQLIVGCIGALAADAIAQAVTGRVTAVFGRSAYIELGRQWICIGGREIGCGPLNALAESTDALHAWLRAVQPGARVAGNWPRFRIGDAKLDFARATRWHPPMPALPVDAKCLARGVARIRTAACDRTPDDGLAFLVAGVGLANPLAQIGGEAAHALHDWVANDAPYRRRSPPEALTQLVGLGPGLTPSGDDFLGGALVALHAFGKADAARALGAWLSPLCAHATHPVSVAHLAAAAKGEGNEALHACLLALADGYDAAEALDAIAAVGHTSGWDALAGALTVAAAI